METTLPNVRHLIAFSEVARQKRIGLASDKVHLSQPAITQAIAKFERLLGTELFDRRPSGMFLTEVGEILNLRIDRLLSHLQLGNQLALKRAARGTAPQGRREFFKLATQVQLQACVAVARSGSFSQAARDIGARQPAVHRAARELESIAGIQFFETVRRGVALTAAGEAFVHHVQLAAAEWRQAGYEVSAFLGKDSTRIAIGALPLSRTSILPSAIDELLASSGSGLQIQCVEAPYPSLLRDLRTGDIDFIIGALRNPNPGDEFVQEPLFSDELCIVTRAEHPLMDQATPTLEDTLSYPWIAPPKPTPSGTYLFESLRIQDMPETPVRIVSSSLVLVRGLMRRGDYVTIMSPEQFDTERQLGLLAAVPISLSDSARDIGLTYRKDWRPTRTQGQFLNLIRKHCGTQPSPLQE